jgi:hypothetical protein
MEADLSFMEVFGTDPDDVQGLVCEVKRVGENHG